MSIPMNILLDLALGLCLLSILYTSWRRGFVASFIRLVGTAAGFLLASFLSGPVSERLYGSLLEERVEQYVGDTLLAPGSPLLEALAGLDQAGSAAIQAISGFLAEQGPMKTVLASGWSFFTIRAVMTMGVRAMEM